MTMRTNLNGHAKRTSFLVKMKCCKLRVEYHESWKANVMSSENTPRAFIVMFNDANTVGGVSDQSGTRWMCLCGREANVERDGFDVTGGKRVDCPACDRRYFQQPIGDVYEMES